EARRQVDEPRALGEEPLLQVLVERNVCAAESIDRLLGITDEEKFARNGTGDLPIRFGRIVRREQKEDLRLKRVGVLELVDEEMRDALLKLVTDRSVVQQEIARADEQIQEVELSRSRLEILVAADETAAGGLAPQLAEEKRREVGIRRTQHALELRFRF